MPDRFTDQSVLVTGGAQGLGRAMVERFAREGAHVHVADRNEEALAATAEAINGTAPIPITPHVVDVSDPAMVDHWVSTCIAADGRIDVLVNNAGIIRDDRVERISNDDWTPSSPST